MYFCQRKFISFWRLKWWVVIETLSERPRLNNAVTVCVSVLQTGWVTLGPLKKVHTFLMMLLLFVLVFYKLDG